MRKVIVVVLVLFFTVLNAEKRVEFNKDIPFIVKGINFPVNSNVQLDNFVKLQLPNILKIDSKIIHPEISSSQKIGHTTFHRISYSVNGIPVLGVHTVLKQKNGAIRSVINAAQDINVDTKPAINALEASKKVVLNNYSVLPKNPDFRSKLVIIERFGKYRLAWRIRFRPASPIDGRYYYVDAHSGLKLGGGNFVRNVEPTNMAKVFLSNPIRDEEAVEIELPWIADDAEGKLTSVVDDEGIRKIVTANCPVLGDTVDYYGSTLDICTATQMANKIENGSFIYEDWDEGLDFKKDVEDIYSEVAMYHHISRIYTKLMSLGLDSFTNIGIHKDKNPIIGIANFQMASQTGKLSSMDNAFYSPHDPYFSEMFFKDFEYKGDMLVLGQGSKADFAYDGDVIYHEFGHATVEGTAQLSFASSPDKYGYSNETMGLDEGMADTFSFLIAGDPCLGEYVSEAYGSQYGYSKIGDFYCMRHAENENIVNENFNGESHHDGLPAVAAHWELYQAVLEAGHSSDEFIAFYVSALLSVPFSDLKYKKWADILLETSRDMDFSYLRDKFEKILENRGFFNEIRARNIENKTDYLFSGGVAQYQGYPSETIEVEIEGSKMEVAPMYVQLYYDVPECIDTVTISGIATDGQSMNAASAPKYNLLSRKGEPILWTVDDIPFRVDYDSYVMGSSGSWTVKNLEPGNRYYFQLINTGPSGMLYNPKYVASWTSKEECVAETSDEEDVDADSVEETDNETSDEDTTTDPEDDDKNESGCSVLIF